MDERSTGRGVTVVSEKVPSSMSTSLGGGVMENAECARYSSSGDVGGDVTILSPSPENEKDGETERPDETVSAGVGRRCIIGEALSMLGSMGGGLGLYGNAGGAGLDEASWSGEPPCAFSSFLTHSSTRRGSTFKNAAHLRISPYVTTLTFLRESVRMSISFGVSTDAGAGVVGETGDCNGVSGVGVLLSHCEKLANASPTPPDEALCGGEGSCPSAGGGGMIETGTVWPTLCLFRQRLNQP